MEELKALILFAMAVGIFYVSFFRNDKKHNHR